MTVGQPPIDVRHLLKVYTVEQLNQTADDYFGQFSTPDEVGRLLAKPFLSAELTPDLLLSFANVVQGLHLGMDLAVLDFGAGPCWATRYLTQMGMRVIACDVSRKALELGKKGFELYPVQGPHHRPRFLHFDSHRIDLPDASVDRVFCQDAFHHVPNQEEVLRELARVLKPGGVAGFSEPGPNHSKSDVSQHEMRNFTVIENDIVLEDIWPKAREAGFSDVRVGYFTPLLTLMTMREYSSHLYCGRPLPRRCSVPINAMLRERRMFFLYRLPEGALIPGDGATHRAEVRVELAGATFEAGAPIEATVRVRNTGNAVWLQGHTMGAYNVGVRRAGGFLRRRKLDLGRIWLPTTKKCGYLPGEEVTAHGVVPGLPKGRHRLIFDLVSEGLFWFADLGNTPSVVTVDVR
jgi:ubiquinone/menaquinone biosynthesis C-methylase UbiE